jgi:hypothetical protein
VQDTRDARDMRGARCSTRRSARPGTLRTVMYLKKRPSSGGQGTVKAVQKHDVTWRQGYIYICIYIYQSVYKL